VHLGLHPERTADRARRKADSAACPFSIIMVMERRAALQLIRQT
jgi:hypothetical protein